MRFGLRRMWLVFLVVALAMALLIAPVSAENGSGFLTAEDPFITLDPALPAQFHGDPDIGADALTAAAGGPPNRPAELGRQVAQELLHKGGAEILNQLRQEQQNNEHLTR